MSGQDGVERIGNCAELEKAKAVGSPALAAMGSSTKALTSPPNRVAVDRVRDPVQEQVDVIRREGDEPVGIQISAVGSSVP